MPNVLPNQATTNITDTYTYMKWVQETTDGYFFPSILFGLFIIIFVMLRPSSSNGKALLGSSFIIMVISIMLATLGFLSSGYMYASIIITAISAVMAYLENTE